MQTSEENYARIPYDMTNVRDVWECDLLDVEFYAKYNENFNER